MAHSWSSSNFKEIFPDRVSVYTDSIAEEIFNGAFVDQYGSYGIRLDAAILPLVRVHEKKIFMNMSSLAGLTFSMWGARVEDLIESLGGHVVGDLPTHLAPIGRFARAAAALAAVVAGARAAQRQIAAENRFAAWRADHFTGASERPPLPYRNQDEALAALRQRLADHLRIGVLSSAAVGLFRRLFERANPGHAVDGLALLSQLSDAPNIRRHRHWSTLVESAQRSGPIAVDFEPQIRAFLVEHGHRSIFEMEVSVERPVENPAAFAASLPSAAPSATAKTRPSVDASVTRLNPITQGALRFACWSLTLRERSKSVMAMEVYFLRSLLMRLAQDNAVDGITRPQDVFFLRRSEVDALITGQLPSARVLIKGRMSLSTTEAPADNFVETVETGTSQLREPETVQRDELRGVAISAGATSGVARIIHRIDDLARLRYGEIAVVPALDSGWNEVFMRAAGVITETGGIMSHAAILLREQGTPAIFNVRGATSLLADGDRLTIDCSNGRVALAN